MRAPHILLLNKNVGELRRQLAHILGKKSAQLFDADVKKNVTQLFALGEHHADFARSLSANNWRQIVSRSYYGAYGISKAIRLGVVGHHSTDVKDHDRIGDLPEDFPEKNTFANRLRLLRDDRNLCDYDHTTELADLAIPPGDALRLVEDFRRHGRAYLRARSIAV